MAITSLRFYKGSFPVGSSYTNGAIYFDNSTHQIRVGKGGTDSYDAFGGAIKDVTFANSKLTISFLDGRADVIVDFSTTEGLVTALNTRVGSVENQIADLKVTVGSPTIDDQPATGLFKKVEDAQTTANAATTAAATAQTTAENAASAAQDAYNLASTKLGAITVGSAIINSGTATAPNLNVKLSEAIGNTLEIKEDGLYVNAPSGTDYSVTITESAPEGVAKRYTITQCGSTIGTIDLPKDMVVSAGTVRKPTAEEAVEYGVSEDEDYIVLTLANVEEKPLIFIPVAGLIQTYTSGSQAGDPVVISINDEHKVTASITAGAIGITYLDNDVRGALEKAHTHTNKSVLDSIGEARVAAWDAAAAKKDIVFNTEYNASTNKAATMADVAAATPGVATSENAGIVKIGSGSGLNVTADGSLSVDSDVYKVKDLSEGTGIKVTLKEGKHEIAVKIDNNSIKATPEGELYVDTAAIADIPIATEEKVGVVRGAGDIKVDANGDMTLGWALYN